ncbi:MAG: hypothetical protein KF915_18510 [Polyangiaceae bacterium]|nr:hypothetical protein [Polyangiaceae bacterium]
MMEQAAPCGSKSRVMEIPLTVVARNEERAIGACLESLLASARYAEARLPLCFAPLVVLDDCRDGTEAEVRRLGVLCVASHGGKVEGQRRGQRPGPFQIFSDADLLVSEDTLCALCEVMLEASEVQVAFPPKLPLEPRRRTPIAWALHVYNLRRGFSSQRTWFSGKLFAIRRWSLPTPLEVLRRAERLPRRAFYDYGAPLQVDDVLLSRQAVAEGGASAVRETARGLVRYRAPETLQGMYRTYRRLRRELERTDALFPETRPVHRQFGERRADQLASAQLSERAAWLVFQAALMGCRAVYRVDRLAHDLGASPARPWPPIVETKEL